MEPSKKRNPRNTSAMVNLQYGKIPPQAVDVEEAVIGALMLERDAYLDVSNSLTPEMFYKESHQKIYTTILSMTARGGVVDLLTVTNELKNTGLLEEVGGPVEITRLTSKVASAAHIEFHARIIQGKYIRRKLIELSNKIQNESYDESNDIDDLYEGFQASVLSLFSPSTNTIKTFAEASDEVVNVMMRNLKSDSGMAGLPTGFKRFDSFSGGLQNTDLIVIAAETSQGKTAMAVTIANNLLHSHRVPIGVVSLEMSAMQLTARFIAQDSGVVGKDILMKKLPVELVDHVGEHISKMRDFPVYFDEDSNNHIEQICNVFRRMVMKYGIRIGIVDYIQLATGPKSEGREEEVGAISRALKNVAKELNIPIIALSQLRRDRDPKPTLNRLRASGQIEEAADLVILIWRPSTYGISSIETDDETYDSKGKAEVLIAKGRNIGKADFILGFDEATGKFYDLETIPKYEIPQSVTSPEIQFDPTAALESNNEFDKPGNSLDDDTPF